MFQLSNGSFSFEQKIPSTLGYRNPNESELLSSHASAMTPAQ
jgi:hypothetical protein